MWSVNHLPGILFIALINQDNKEGVGKMAFCAVIEILSTSYFDVANVKSIFQFRKFMRYFC